MKIQKYLKFVLESINTHSYYLPSYEECRSICDAHDNFIFFESHHEIDGYKISIFNYRLAQHSDFESPIPNSNLKAYEMRGLTFVWNKDGSLYKRYLLLDKFFNLDQTPCSMYSIVKNFKIKNIFNKEDGSIASFVKLPNGEVIGKSKTSFASDQAIEIQKIYDTSSTIREFVNFCLDSNIDPIFEFVSPTNRIVLTYANTDLVLLKMRNNETGEYLDIDNFSDKLDGISVVASENGHDLDSIREVTLKATNKEGVVIQFENGKMIKIKSNWYMERHRLFTDEINRENTLIKMIVEETIDDVVSQLDQNDPKRNEIIEITNIINEYIKRISNEVDSLVSDYNGSRKDFAIKYIKNKLFPISMGIINGKNKIDLIKLKILSDTKNLMEARKWIQDQKIL